MLFDFFLSFLQNNALISVHLSRRLYMKFCSFHQFSQFPRVGNPAPGLRKEVTQGPIYWCTSGRAIYFRIGHLYHIISRTVNNNGKTPNVVGTEKKATVKIRTNQAGQFLAIINIIWFMMDTKFLFEIRRLSENSL